MCPFSTSLYTIDRYIYTNRLSGKQVTVLNTVLQDFTLRSTQLYKHQAFRNSIKCVERCSLPRENVYMCEPNISKFVRSVFWKLSCSETLSFQNPTQFPLEYNTNVQNKERLYKCVHSSVKTLQNCVRNSARFSCSETLRDHPAEITQ